MVTVVPGLTSPRVEPPQSTTPSTALKVKRATVTFDRTWSPYIQGDMTCLLQTTAEATATDPRKGLCVKFTLTQAYGSNPVQSLPLILYLRSRSGTMLAGETVLQLASIESMLQDYVYSSGVDYTTTSGGSQADTTTLSDAVAGVSNLPALGQVVTLGGAAPFSVLMSESGWSAGSSAWDVMSSLEETGQVWLRGDETAVGLYRMAPGYSADTSTHLITGSDRVLSADDTTSRDDPNWANAVAISYPNSPGKTIVYGSAATADEPIKVAFMTRVGRHPASTATANAIASRMRARGRQLRVTAISDLTARPNQTWRVKYRGNDWTGTLQSVAFRYPDGLMDMTINI
jgi:hypothetical protein